MGVFSVRLFRLAWLGLLLSGWPALAGQIALDRVEAMPNLPEPYLMRDWKQVARDYDALVFDFSRQGDYLPLIWWDKTHLNVNRDTFGLPSYVGTPFQTGEGAHESINTIGMLVGATLAGIDKSNQTGQNWVAMQENYFNSANGENVFLNLTSTSTGQTFWYEVFPNILMTKLVNLYPGEIALADKLKTSATRWYQAACAVGGLNGGTPNFDHTAINLKTMTPVDNGLWREPDAAAGIAWVQFMAWRKWGTPYFLDGADMGLRFLQARPADQNPFYEILLPYGAYLAARMNAELGRSYDVQKLLTWCLGPSAARPDFGVIADRWGDVDAHGLVGSFTDGGGYGFAMNTFDMASVLAPLVRYDDRYARAIGKLVLHMANAARLFYPVSLAPDHQSGWAWASQFDPAGCIAYEGVRNHGRVRRQASADARLAASRIISGSFQDTQYLQDGRAEVLEEVTVGTHDQLDHIWRLDLPAAPTGHTLFMNAWVTDGGDADAGFILSYASDINGPYTPLFTITNGATAWPGNFLGAGLPASLQGPVYLRVEDTDHTAGQVKHDQLTVDCLFTIGDLAASPYGMGDGISGYPWGTGGKGTATDFGLYGSSFVGELGGIVEKTNVEGILQLDCLKTDYYHVSAYPTWLYYNPYGAARLVTVDVGAQPRDLYDAAGNRFLARGVTGPATFTLAADSAALVVVAPAGGAQTVQGSKLPIDGVVVDYDKGNYTSAAISWEAY